MDLIRSPVKRARFILRFLIAAMLAFALGCGGGGDDDDIAVVDFSETVVVE